MKRSAHLRNRDLALIVACAALLAAVGCGEKKSETEAAGPRSGAAADAQKTVAPKPIAGPRAGDDGKSPPKAADPLLGTWKVVRAEGRYSEQNTGVTWSFGEGGKAFSVSLVDPSVKGRDELPVSRVGTVERRTDWSWKRVGPDSIELSPPGSPEFASIRHRFDGAELVLDWNNGSQILHLAKKAPNN
jgi:hypothetical protein